MRRPEVQKKKLGKIFFLGLVFCFLADNGERSD